MADAAVWGKREIYSGLMKRTEMAGGNILRKGLSTKKTMVLSAPGRRAPNGEKAHGERWAGTRRNDVSRAHRPLHGIDNTNGIDAMPEAQETARLSGAAIPAPASMDVASWDGHPLPQRCLAETASLALCEA